MDGTLRISEAFELYRVEHIVYLNQSAKTEEMHVYAMKSLIAFAGDIPIADLSFEQVRKWKESMSRRIGSNTVRGYIIKLRVVLKHLAIRGYKNILNYEMVGIPKKQDKPISFLTPREVDNLVNIAFRPLSGYKRQNRYRNRALIYFLYSSGIRVSELCKLDIADLREDNTFTIIGKGRKTRLCFFDDKARYYIDEYLETRDDNCTALFITGINSSRITAGVVQLIFRRLSEEIGKHVTPHTMRHSYATDMLRNNTNLVYVRDFLGHNSVQTTEMYTHVVNEDLRAIYREKHTS